MKERRPHHLKEGTVLDDRYVIGGLLGEGGFGITYAAEHIRTHAKAAVKEFYCPDFMTRSVSESDEPRLTDERAGERFQREKERFLKEARTLRDFADCPGIVHVLECFEANGTAYIIMELLDGVTLKEHVGRNGRMEAETVMRKVIPLLRTLGVIHRSGLIHRDISPDNIMMREDGTLTLMDFGAAREFSTQTVSHSLIYKDGFAPKEQFDRRGKLGPFTDLYSLCATLYFCVTGKAPEDAIQRVLYDELKSPSLLGVDIPKEAEAVIMKGLSMRPGDRWQSAGEMLEHLLVLYPEHSEEEDRRRRKKKRMIRLAAAAVLIMAAAAGLSYRMLHRTEIRFRNLDTETVWLYQDEIPDGKFDEAKRAERARLEAFAGKDNYLWKEDGENLQITFPRELLAGRKTEYVMKAYLTRSLGATLRVPAGEVYYDLPLEREQLVNVREHTGSLPFISRADLKLPEEGDYTYFTAELSPDAVSALESADAAFASALEGEGNYLQLFFDLEEYDTGAYYMHTYAAGDGKTICIVDMDQDEQFSRLIFHDLTTEELPASFSFNTEPHVTWERVSGSLMAGKNQKNEEELTGEYILLRYETGVVGKGNWFNLIAVYKERLDAVGKPYAFGVDEYEERTIVVKMRPEDLLGTEAEYLGERGEFYLYTDNGLLLTSFSRGWTGNYGDVMEITESGDGSWAVRFPLADYKVESIGEKLDSCAEGSVSEVRLCIGNDRGAVASVPVGTFRGQLKEGEIVFSRLFAGSDRETGPENRSFGDFLSAFFREDPVYGSALTSIRFFLADGTPDISLRQLAGYPFDRNLGDAEAVISALKQDGGDGVYDITDNELELLIPAEKGAAFPEKAAEIMGKTAAEYSLTDGRFHRVRFVMRNPSAEEGISVYIQREVLDDKRAGEMKYRTYYEGVSDRTREAFEAFLARDPVFKNLYREE